MPAFKPSTIQTTSSLGLVTLLSVFSLASSAVAIPIKLPSWLRPNASTSPTSSNIIVVGSKTPTGTSANTTTASTPATTAAPTTVAASTTTAGQAGFQCQFVNGQYTVMYLPQSQPSLAYPWAVPRSMGGGWTPERRCAEISRRLEMYRPDGMIELQTSQENGYNTVCVTTQKAPGCRIVFTVPNGQDPTSTRDMVFQNLAYAEQGQQTQGVNTFMEQGGSSIRDMLKLGKSNFSFRKPALTSRTASGGIDLRPFLDQADGGTGARLQKGVPRSTR